MSKEHLDLLAILAALAQPFATGGRPSSGWCQGLDWLPYYGEIRHNEDRAESTGRKARGTRPGAKPQGVAEIRELVALGRYVLQTGCMHC